MKNTGNEYSVATVCGRVGMSRQNYYAARRLRQRRTIEEDLIVKLVERERQSHPRLGGRKLLHVLKMDFQEAGVRVGRDRFFELLAERDLLVPPKAGKPYTTNSRHYLPVFENLIKEFMPTGPNQLWVSDLTYIRTEEGFVFAAVIMDRFSRKIVGAHIADSLETETCVQALEQALKGLPEGMHPIHHSDRGCQYCSHAYVGRLQARGLSISMTEQFHCYENAHAERVIGILKQEYNLDAPFRTKAQAYKAFNQAIDLYNHRRPHTALKCSVPAQVHQQAA
jgi:transposase InsO family protein